MEYLFKKLSSKVLSENDINNIAYDICNQNNTQEIIDNLIMKHDFMSKNNDSDILRVNFRNLNNINIIKDSISLYLDNLGLEVNGDKLVQKKQ